MSVDGTKLLFEGFLQKRKDTMSHLRGNYYIYTVQSVREVQRADSSRFMFEIIMKNGKRKMLELNSEEAVYENTLLALDYRHQNGEL
ncbi:Hypothetical protein SMAX5B_021068 [Scophthalmus maximus]|uniref:Uncharacterized protein n=1 Tax=Scophthalmus maximus TaxID=52904 RepID=A0A2U9CQ91_SCOMX|nr:Hypothetical protein SMAX5B_021068 [Scophthalmus maximus]